MLNRIRRHIRTRLVRAVHEVVAEHHGEYEKALAAGIDRALTAIRDAEFRARRDLFAASDRDAAASSARFAREMMPKVPTFHNPTLTLDYALTLAPAEGMALEFGVYTGGTLKMIADARNDKQVFGFDSFEGLPEDWRTSMPAGTFSTDQLPDVPGAELIVGWFDDTLADFLAGHPGPVAFLHLDADLYSSTVTVLEHVGPRLRPGTVIVFDEYFNYPGWEQHEYRAWQEYVAKSGIEFRYEAYTSNNEQVVMVVTGLGDD
ncbi:MAG: TylF/MycF/NovP-related O-methyltransferase [Pseudonocardiaceae bacterium]